jgi:cytidylate kinase
MPGVTISAGYGAGGSIVAPKLAERLGYPLLDRAISSRIAALLHVTVEEAQGGAIKRSLAERFFGSLAPLAGGVIGIGAEGEPDAPLPLDDAAQFRELAETIMFRALEDGAVILGRAGAAATRDRGDVFRVRLFGPEQARIEQAARLEGVDIEIAAQRLPEVDQARAQYVRRLYGCDIDDPQLFHLQIDGTAVPPDACVEIIATAYEGQPDLRGVEGC